MPAHRQTALLLHGLHRSDQRWLLAQLGSDDRQVLRKHLDELSSLGIPAAASVQADAVLSDKASGVITLDNATAYDIQQILQLEPVWMQRQLLAIADWAWRDAYLSMLSPLQRQEIAEPAAPLSARARQAFIAEVNRRLGTVLSSMPPAPVTRSVNPLRKLMRALGWGA